MLAASLAFVGIAVGTASATTLEDCQAQLATLVDFQTTLNSPATASKVKVDAGTAASLTAEAQGVIDWINAIGTEP